MQAERIMVKDPITCRIDESIGVVLQRMRKASLRMLPVVEASGRIAGVLSTFSVLARIVPEYIVSGDLDAVPYAPDLGVLSRNYCEIANLSAREVMDVDPLLVEPDQSLLSVAAALLNYGKHEYALVADEERRLLGVISAGDVLDCLRALRDGECE
ncbi:MAG: CBS domain-containing protein [Mariprofundaceae bacterium]